MFYKEWLVARPKFVLILLAFVLAAGFIASVSLLTDTSTQLSLFHIWLNFSMALAMGAGIMGSVDSVAAERNSNTLSFLMSRSVSRTKIYLSKLGVNALWVATAFGTTSFFMLMVDQIPRLASSYETTIGPCRFMSIEFLGYVQANSTPIWTGLFQIGTAIMISFGVLTIGMLVSIFSQNVSISLMFTILSVFSVYVAGAILGSLLFGLDTGNYFSLEKLPITFTSVTVFTAIVLVIGLMIFRRKEFS